MSDPEAILAIHYELLARWRKAMDLVGPGPLEPHFEDARGAVAGLDAKGRWADLGSGAGFPGIALAAFHPEAEVVLVESRQKRATFLERVVMQAKLENARVERLRTEDLPDASFDGVISRAYKPPPAYLEDAARLLAAGGRVVLMLGDVDGFTAPVGFSEEGRLRYPVGDGHRLRVVLRKDQGRDNS